MKPEEADMLTSGRLGMAYVGEGVRLRSGRAGRSGRAAKVGELKHG